MRHCAKQGMKGFSWLEIKRTVFDLQDDIVAELPIERLKLLVGLRHPVVVVRRVVDESAPHHDPAMRGQCVGEEIRSIGMGAAVVLRSWLAFRVGLYQEAAKIRDELVYLVRFGPPPPDHRGVKGIGGGKATDSDRRAKAGGQVDSDAVRPEHAREGGHLC